MGLEWGGVNLQKNKCISEANLGLRSSKGHLLSQSMVSRPGKCLKGRPRTTTQDGMTLDTFGAEMETMILILKREKKIPVAQ